MPLEVIWDHERSLMVEWNKTTLDISKSDLLIWSKNPNYFMIANFHIYPINSQVIDSYQTLSIHNHWTGRTISLIWNWNFGECIVKISFFQIFTFIWYLFVSNHFICFVQSLSQPEIWRPRNLEDVKNEIGWDWGKVVETKTISRVTLITVC